VAGPGMPQAGGLGGKAVMGRLNDAAASMELSSSQPQFVVQVHGGTSSADDAHDAGQCSSGG
jgi:hypothetical protein